MIAITALLVYKGRVKTPEVSIDFDVGEIVGGVLVGVASLVAGLAYAFRER